MPRTLLAGVFLFLGGCAAKPPVALTWLDATRMQVVLVDPDAPLPAEAKAREEALAPLAPLSFEPHWSPSRKRIAFTRVTVSSEGLRILSVKDLEAGTLQDIAAVGVAEWTGYGFAPTWSPDGTALAFKLRSERETGVFVAFLDEGRVAQLLPDPARQIRELAWGAWGFAFNVAIGGLGNRNHELKWIEMSASRPSSASTPLERAAKALSLGEGALPRFFKDSLYYIRAREQGGGFELVRRERTPGGIGEAQVVLGPIGPYYDVSSSGVIAYQSDPEGRGAPIRLTLQRPGEETPQISPLSSYHFRFSPDGKRLVGVRLTGDLVSYFVYDPSSGRVRDFAGFQPQKSAQEIVQILDYPLFDW